MKKPHLLRTMLTIIIILTMTACNRDTNNVTIDEPAEDITTVADDSEPDTEDETDITVEKIDRYEKVNITDWLDEETLIVSKDNEALDKMKLAELSDYYPRSLYLLDITTKDYTLLMEQENTFLSGAVLSGDKKYLLYQEYDLGDPAFNLLNMDTMEGFRLAGDPIGGAISAKWADNETLIGAAYSGGAYLADRTGKITLVDGLKDETLYLVEKGKDSIYYNTQYDYTLMKLDLQTGEKVKLNFEQVYHITLSPGSKQMLISQADVDRNILLVYDLESGVKQNIAEGTEIYGMSWSPDQRLIAYYLKDDKDNTSGSLYVYDMLTGKATRVAEDVNNPGTVWSPSGIKLAFSEWDGTQYSSSIINFKYSD